MHGTRIWFGKLLVAADSANQVVTDRQREDHERKQRIGSVFFELVEEFHGPQHNALLLRIFGTIQFCCDSAEKCEPRRPIAALAGDLKCTVLRDDEIMSRIDVNALPKDTGCCKGALAPEPPQITVILVTR